MTGSFFGPFVRKRRKVLSMSIWKIHDHENSIGHLDSAPEIRVGGDYSYSVLSTPYIVMYLYCIATGANIVCRTDVDPDPFFQRK